MMCRRTNHARARVDGDDVARERACDARGRRVSMVWRGVRARAGETRDVGDGQQMIRRAARVCFSFD